MFHLAARGRSVANPLTEKRRTSVIALLYFCGQYTLEFIFDLELLGTTVLAVRLDGLMAINFLCYELILFFSIDSTALLRQFAYQPQVIVHFFAMRIS